MITDKQRHKRIEKAQVSVLYSVPFFAAGVCKLPVEFADDVPTACTNGMRIRFGREFLDKLEDAEIPTILCHEVAHCLLGHLWRIPGDPERRNWPRWNQATDHAINNMLMEFSQMVMSSGKGGYADPLPWPTHLKDKICADPQYAGLSEEVIDSRLAASEPPGDGSGQGKSGKSGAPGKQGTPGGSNGDAGTPGIGQMEPSPEPGPGNPDQPTSKQLLNDWTATLLQSAKAAAGQGKLPGSMAKMIEELINPKINWVDLLRSWLREQCAEDWDWLTPDMSMDESGFILPSLKSEQFGAVVFGSDWSGSTYGELVKTFHGEKQGCLDEMRPAKLIDIGFDTRIVWEKEYLPGDRIDQRIAGGGGTSFVDVLKRCSEMVPAPKCVVILTDLDGAFPTEVPTYPVVWVAYGTNKKAPFGETIHAE